MKPMATKRKRRLHPQIIQAEYRDPWPVLDESTVMESARSKLPQQSDPHETLVQTVERIMSR